MQLPAANKIEICSNTELTAHGNYRFLNSTRKDRFLTQIHSFPVASEVTKARHRFNLFCSGQASVVLGGCLKKKKKMARLCRWPCNSVLTHLLNSGQHCAPETFSLSKVAKGVSIACVGAMMCTGGFKQGKALTPGETVLRRKQK